MPNPETLIRFGICPRCGRTGTNDDGDRLTGYELQSYRGEYMCQFCINRLQDEEYDELSNQRYNEDQQFRDKIGIKYQVE